MKTIIATIISQLIAAAAFATPSLYWEQVDIPSPSPHPLTNGAQLSLDVDFGIAFTSIVTSPLILTFEDDLWDLGETIGVFFPGPFGYIGIASTAHEPYDPHSWSTTLGWEPASSALMDGTTDFYIESINGSVGIQSCTISLTAEAVPEPSSLLLVLLGIAELTITKSRTRGWSLRFARGGQNETHP